MDYQTAFKLVRNNKLRKLRKEHIKSQENICEVLKNAGFKIDRTTYSKYETGKRKIPCEVLVVLADYYDVSTDYLLGIERKTVQSLNEAVPFCFT